MGRMFGNPDEYPALVNDLTKAVAERALAVASADLELEGVRLAWVHHGDINNSMAKVRSSRPDRIYVRFSLPPDRSAEVVAHECRHLWQYAHDLYDPRKAATLDGYQQAKRDGEADADAYGKKVAAQVNPEFKTQLLIDKIERLNADMKAAAAAAPEATKRSTAEADAVAWMQEQLRIRERYESAVEARGGRFTRSPGGGWLTEAVEKHRGDYEAKLERLGYRRDAQGRWAKGVDEDAGACSSSTRNKVTVT